MAASAAREPLLVLEPLRTFLADHGLLADGDGDLRAEPLGEGHSNVTFLLRCGPRELVLRRPPRGPLPPSAHDVLREARLAGSTDDSWLLGFGEGVVALAERAECMALGDDRGKGLNAPSLTHQRSSADPG